MNETPLTTGADLFALVALGRLRRGTHYVMDDEPDDPEDGPPHFRECTPTQRGKACPLCQAAAAGSVPADAVEAYRITSPDWSSGCILPDLRAALDVIGEELQNGHEQEATDFSVRRLWMLRAEMDRLPEFEG